MQQKTEKIFLDFEIIAFDLVALDTFFYWQRIHVIGCQYVNKQSQDLRYSWNRIVGADFILECSKSMKKNTTLQI